MNEDQITDQIEEAENKANEVTGRMLDDDDDDDGVEIERNIKKNVGKSRIGRPNIWWQ